jgi:hypothetical protein
MSERRDSPPPEVQTLLDREREIPPVPAAVRARALARARAAIAAGPPAKVGLARTPPSRLRWAAVAVMLLVASAAAGAAVYQYRARLVLRRAVPPPARPALVAPTAVPATKPPAAVTPEEAPSPLAPPARPAVDAAAAELRLVAAARAAVARQDYAGALPPIAEHSRRFKNGRLAEEREALRVRALAGLGRTDEARRAAHSFETRFPRSVLLPAVKQMSAATP